MNRWWRLGAVGLALCTVSGCGAAAPEARTPEGKAAAKTAAPVTMITPSRLVPELDTDHLASWFSEPGVEKYLLSGMRILVRDDGSIERGSERFPSGSIQALPLPDRLGSGYVFYQSDSQGTRIWRAKGWVDPLEPLAFLGPSTQEITAGFDRLYVRTRSNTLMALDADTGAVMPLGGLPAAPRLGHMVFADGWRAVVDTDLRGPLATFDAGVSWRPLGIDERVNSMSMASAEGDPVLYVPSGSYRLDAAGHLQFVAYQESAPPAAGDEDDDTEPSPPPEHPLGSRPLRTALTTGWPDSKDSGIVLHGGKLVRVALPSAKVLARKNTDVSEDATCQGARVGKGFGFICGEGEGATRIYRLKPPLDLELVAEFETPRFVSPSGNGSLVVRGACEGDGLDGGQMRTYCILHENGTRREVAVRGEIGAERVVAMRDGRVVVLVPPRFGRPGRLTVIDGDSVKGHELTYPKEPQRAVKVARRGLWLEGFEQRSDKSIGGWVEAGGPAVGVTVTLDGEVVPGKIYDEGGQLLVAGKLAIATSDAETGFESVDGGKSWKEFELPRLPESPGDAKSRGCSPLGCAMRGWLRVGWGKLAVPDDLHSVPKPKAVSMKSSVRPSMELDCHFVSAPHKPVVHKSVGSQAPYSAWTAFRDVLPPALAKDEIGVDKESQSYSEIGVHLYVWGAKGADWSRTGWWQMRFEDPFALENAVRSSALTRPPWSDEVTASEAIGARHYGSYWRWEAALDPSGDAALVNLCNGSTCEYYAVTEGRPILELRAPSNATYGNRRPVPNGVARVGESWYMLTETHSGGALSLWRANLGAMQELFTFRRLYDNHFQGNTTTPQLVRRALGAEIGLLFTRASDPATGVHVDELFVLPIDPLDKTLASPISLGPIDLDGKVPGACADHDDGWVLETALPRSPDIDLKGTDGYVDEVRLRVRLSPGKSCIESISAKAGRTLGDAEVKAAPAGAAIPLAVRERYTGRRWGFMCGAR